MQNLCRALLSVPSKLLPRISYTRSLLCNRKPLLSRRNYSTVRYIIVSLQELFPQPDLNEDERAIVNRILKHVEKDEIEPACFALPRNNITMMRELYCKLASQPYHAVTKKLYENIVRVPVSDDDLGNLMLQLFAASMANKHEMVISLFEKISHIADPLPMIYLANGIAHYEMQDYGKAFPYLVKGLNDEDNNEVTEKALKFLINIVQHMKKDIKIDLLPYCHRLLNLVNGVEVEMCIQCMMKYAPVQENYDMYEGLFQRFPDSYKLNEIVISALLEQFKSQEAKVLLKKGLKLSGQTGSMHYLQGLAHQQVEELEEAKKYYLETLTYTPNNSSALNNLADCYRNQGKFSEAIEYFSKALEISANKEGSELHFQMAAGLFDSLRRGGRKQEASEVFKYLETRYPQLLQQYFQVKK
jgi:tetratricopeptide (TPR) repeat protein